MATRRTPWDGPEPWDLDAYFERIGYSGSRTPTLATLEAIVLRHALSIPFENLDPFMKRPVKLDAASLQRKLVDGGRGGWCFEQNLLLGGMLRALGYDVAGLAGRVLWTRAEDARTAKTHMLLRVDLDGETYLADVGFGGLTLTGVLRLAPAVEQPTPHERFRIDREGADFIMRAQIGDAWPALYRFDLQEQLLEDYELSNWYLANHPASPFVTGVICARAVEGKRFALRGGEFATHALGGPTVRRAITDAELPGLLSQVFGIAVEP
jgi:N-hydroxyarylamine O-acetyltransferase